MKFHEIVNSANQIYHLKTSMEELTQVAIQLSNIIKDKFINEENKTNAEALAIKVSAKIYAIKYFDGGYYQEDFEKLSNFLTSALPYCQKRGWNRCVEILLPLDEVSKKIREVMVDAGEIIASTRDENDKCTTTSIEYLLKVNDIFQQKIATVQTIADTSKLFGEKVVMIDVKNKAIKDLQDYCDWLQTAVKELSLEQMDYFFKTQTTPLSEEEGDKFFEIAPTLGQEEEFGNPAVVISSPFRDEVLLFARAYASKKGKSFLVFSANSFNEKDSEFIDHVFQSLEYKKQSILLFGLTDFRDSVKTFLIERIIRFSKGGGCALIVDNSGDERLYKEFMNVAESVKDLSLLDVCSKYLTLPSFKLVVNEFEDRNMITGADYDFLRKHLAFMGYVGLNKALYLFARQKGWRDDLLDISKLHESQIHTYVLNIPSQNQLIDLDWIDLSIKRQSRREKKQFDYDSVRIANPENVKKILESNFSIFAKCGLVARYALLAGDDVSAWQNLLANDKTERLTLACKLVCYILDTVYAPAIQVIPDNEWTKKGAGAVCCQGGKLIIFKESCCNDYDWTVSTVCHECFHSLQFTAENGPWQDWYWTQLGVTKNRIPEWRYNNEHYYDASNKSHYNIEIIECDARAFENDCFQQSQEVYNNIDWE